MTCAADKGGEVTGVWVMVPLEPTEAMIAIWQATFHRQMVKRHKKRFSRTEHPEQAEVAAWRAVLKHCASAAPSAPTPANLGDALADLIQVYDDETKPCPARRKHLGDNPCPKCRATARDGCGLDAGASHKFIMNTRALSARYREGNPND